MGVVRKKQANATARKKARLEATMEQKNGHRKVLTAEGWKRIMLEKKRKSSSKTPR